MRDNLPCEQGLSRYILFVGALILAILACDIARAQSTAAYPAPSPEVQFLDNLGKPLAGGKLCTYQAGTTTPLASFTDSTANTANSNPVVLNSSGRASVWFGLSSGLYKMVLLQGGDGTCFTGTTLWSQDNVGIAMPGNLPALYINQTSAGAAGKGGYIDMTPVTYPNQTCFDAYGNPVNQPVQATGYPSFGANDAILWVSESPLAGVGGCASMFTPNQIYGLNLNTYMFALAGFATQISAYNAIDAAPCTTNALCAIGPAGNQGGGFHGLSADLNNYINIGHGIGNPALTPGSNFHNGALYYDDNLACLRVWTGGDSGSFSCLSGGGGGGASAGPNNAVQRGDGAGGFVGDGNLLFAAQILSITGTSSTAIAENVTGYIQTTGGFTTTATATNAIQATAGGILGLTLRTTDSVIWTEEAAPALSAAGQARLYADSSAHVLKVSNNGGAYATFGGSGTVSTGTQYQAAFYTGAGTGTVVGGSANFTFNSSTQLLTVTATSSAVAGIAVVNGFFYSDAGMEANPSTATNYNSIQAPGGGVYGLSVDALHYMKVGTSTGHPGSGGSAAPFTTGDSLTAGIIYFDNSGVFVGYNGSTWVTFAAGSTAAFGSLTAGTNTTAAMVVGSGASLTVSGSGTINANQFNGGAAPSSGSLWKSNGSLQPVAPTYADVLALWTGGGCTGANALLANGACGAGGGGGIPSLNSLTGALNIVGTTNEITVTPSGSSITLSTPQAIAATSNVTFGDLTTGSNSTAGVLQTWCTGASICFQTI